MIIKIKTVQQWTEIQEINKNGIIKLKNNKYIKIIKIIPINYNLKSNLEKESILNSYKILLKSCNFNIQILIQSNKENLEKNILNINKNIKKEKNKDLIRISEDYINFIQDINNSKKSSSKNFYIIISNSEEIRNKNNSIDLIEEELNEKYFKIRECLSRCGNISYSLNSKKEIKKLLFSFFNVRINLTKNKY